MKLALSATLGGLRKVWLLDQPSVRIGRDSSNLVQILDKSVSREHAEIHVERGVPYLKDLRSHNGTRLNDSVVRRSARLKPGDRIQVGRISLEVTDAPRDLPAPDPMSETSTFTLPIGAPPGETTWDVGDISGILWALETAGRVLSDPAPLEESCEAFLATVERAIPASRLAIQTQTECGTQVQISARSTECGGAVSVWIPDGIRRRVLASKSAILETECDAPGLGSESTERVPGRRRSAMAAPLLRAGSATGLLYAEHDSLQGGYTRRHLELLALFANMAAYRIATERLVSIEGERATIEQEVSTAGRIQQWILPQVETSIAGYDIHALFRPCEAVGGDFYDVAPGTDHTAWIVLGDVSGKGICGAMIMTLLMSSARVLYGQCPGPGALANRLNRILLRRGDLGHFATAFIGRLHTASGVLHYVNAGHTRPLLHLRRGFKHLDSTGVPLGVEPQFDYQDETLILQPGDVLAIFSDGLQDTQRGEAFFGEHRVERAFRMATASRGGAEEIATSIFGEAEIFRGEQPFSDDVAMLILKRAAAGA
ncbi:MAG TPA: SpoIIE family protein phosphatase [Candidatus Eisenbacteria bacterium]|nr:SpoIIE family protein phosphatase [Candidatus Eisenbacteria bacterium]